MAEKSSKTRLQVEREKRHLTQPELADRLEVPAKTLGRWERGEQLPRKYNLRQLATFFGEDVDDSWFKIEGIAAVASPLLNIPYDRHPYFLDQRHLVERLRERFLAEGVGASRQAISGLGGVGKTQLALEYAYRYHSEYTTVLWVRVNPQIQLVNDLTSIAKLLQMPEAQKAEPRQRYLVNEILHWLHTKSGWLLILDNAEEGLDAKDADTGEEPLKLDYILAALNDKGHILLTTRSQSLARLVQNFLIEEMQPEEGAQLLLLRDGKPSSPHILDATDETNREEALALSQLLGGLPLALEQARAYIETTNCGFVGYRQLYEECRKELLESVAQGSRLEREYKASVATTWLISFRRVEQQFAVASDVLKLCAYLAPDAIPVTILLKGAEKLDTSLHQLAGNTLQFNHACQILLNYSLIKRNAGRALLSIHRLIQAVLQDRMDDEAQCFWAKQAVQAVEHTFSDALSTHQDIDQYLPHARLCATFIKKLNLEGQEIAHLLEIAAKTFYERGWYAQARPLYLRAHAAASHLLGDKDPHVLSLLLDVAHVHMDLDAAPLAVIIYRSVREKLEQLFGPEHAEIITCLNNLALAELAAGNLPGAEQTGKDALAWYRHDSPSNAVQRATTYAIVAQIAARLRHDQSAEAYYRAALEMRKQVFGMEHSEVAKIAADLGAFYMYYRQDLERAASLLQPALKILKKTLGDDHPTTAECLVYLATLYWEQKNYAEAEACYQQALAIRQQKLGLYHPGVAHILHDLAELTAEQKRDEEATKYFREMLAIASYARGTETYEYALQMRAYADFLQSRGQIDEAAQYSKQIADLTKRLVTQGPLRVLNFSHVNEEGQEITSDQIWFFRRDNNNSL